MVELRRLPPEPRQFHVRCVMAPLKLALVGGAAACVVAWGKLTLVGCTAIYVAAWRRRRAKSD
jgi:hypothetical protein